MNFKKTAMAVQKLQLLLLKEVWECEVKYILFCLNQKTIYLKRLQCLNKRNES